MVTERFYSLILISQSLADSVSLLPQDLGRYLASVRVQQNVQTLLPTCCPADPSLNRQLRRHVVLCLHRKQQLEWKCLLNWLKGWKQGCHLQNNSASVRRNIRDLSETALYTQTLLIERQLKLNIDGSSSLYQYGCILTPLSSPECSATL